MANNKPFKPGETFSRKDENVMEAEWEFLQKAQDLDHQRDSLYGLAISGGGIRSASFGIGVLQALASKDKGENLKKIDYLSTVSGGGYAGASFTYFLHKDKENGTGEDNFPFGQKYVGSRATASGKNALLNFIRQHGNYLIPGSGINAISLFGIVLRGAFISLFVYLTIFTLFMVVLQHSKAFEFIRFTIRLGDRFNLTGNHDIFIWLTYIIVFLLTLSAFYFAIRPRIKIPWGKRYEHIVQGQKLIGFAWTVIFALLVLGSLPYINMALGTAWQKVTAASLSTIFGAVMGVIQFFKGGQEKKATQGFLAGFRIVLGALALIYGLVFASYLLSVLIYKNPFVVAFILAAAIIFGWFVNLNYLGFHRMYRDRLMETFMPDADNISKNQWGAASDADGALLENMCQPRYENDDHTLRPYHLINTNIVLVDSPTSKFRGRGGDNFILSPVYCGSDATGWIHTADYMKHKGRGMTLPTAMAISGAAVNPDTGVAGQGLMRNRFVATLMSLLNIKLGYWAPHPDPDVNKKFPHPPNFWRPGLKGGLLGAGLNEKNSFIELTDGGHFENLGLYELIRRRLKVIIVSDAAADPKYEFGDLQNVVERVRVDFGVRIRFRQNDDANLDGLLPGSKDNGFFADKYKLARRGYAIADIKYDKKYRGTLIYIKSTLTSNLPSDLYGYKSSHSDFPNQTTADQFFNEEQFEAYRELGYQLTSQSLDDPEVQKLIP